LHNLYNGPVGICTRSTISCDLSRLILLDLGGIACLAAVAWRLLLYRATTNKGERHAAAQGFTMAVTL
jgi:hypothetical protein